MLFPSTFTKDNSIIANIYAGGLINTNSDYPALHDLDGDGDLDLIIGGYYGLLYYENKRKNYRKVFHFRLQIIGKL